MGKESSTKAGIPKFKRAPFPYFGGKSRIADEVWLRLGRPKQYIEPFCGSAAILLAAPKPARLEVICDANFYVANLWRCVKYQPESVYAWQDYPVSHVDLDARHRWLTQPERTQALLNALRNPEWHGDAQIAGWWVWGQCCWIGSGWCESQIPHVSSAGMGVQSQIPHVSDAGSGVQSQIPHVGNAGMGVQSQIPHVSDAGSGVQSQIPHVGNAGTGVQSWMFYLSERLARVRVMHGDWTRCLNHHYGGVDTAIFFDPPYLAFERLYGRCRPVAQEVAEWCRNNGEIRIALCGHAGDYRMPGWKTLQWDRGRLTYGGKKTKARECIWFSPGCCDV